MSKDDWVEIKQEDGEVWDRDEVLEGQYLSVKENTGPNESNLYSFKVGDGIIQAWGSTVLDTKLMGLAPKTLVRITPLGKTKSEKTGREYMDFKVEYKNGYTEVEEKIDLDNIPF